MNNKWAYTIITATARFQRCGFDEARALWIAIIKECGSLPDWPGRSFPRADRDYWIEELASCQEEKP